MYRVLAIVLIFAASLASAEPIAYTLNPAESRVGFTWFFGKDAVKGRMAVSAADIVIDFDRVSNSRVAVTLDVANSQAGFPFANQALKAPNMLWVEKFPSIGFRSTRVAQAGTGAQITGDLTMRGVTRPITLAATILRKADTQPGERDELAVRMTGSVSRSAFGATGWKNEIGDEVQLDILAVIDRAD